MARPNGYPMRPGRAAPIPQRVIDRVEARLAKRALWVPRSKLPCDLWLGGVNNSGRPHVYWFDGECDRYLTLAQLQYRVHRFGGGPLPMGVVIGHTCDVGTCGSPDHVYLGNPTMNGSDLRHRGSAKDQGVLEAEVRAQLELRRGTRLPLYFDRMRSQLQLAA
jgi:hypothetical protein